MFEDFEDEDVDVSPEAPDRTIVYAIWARSETRALTAEEAWAILHERYPDDPRFLLLNAYEELADHAATTSFTSGYFVTKLERIAGGATDALTAPLRDLVAYAGGVLAKASGDEATRIAAVRARVGSDADAAAAGKRDERAGLRLRRFEREVLRELHDRTEGGKPLGTRATTVAPPPVSDLATAIADPSRSRKAYSATGRYAKGDLVEHPKFGVGVVTAIEPGRAVILFESGARKLVAG